MSLGGCVGVHLLGVHSESHSDPLLLYLDCVLSTENRFKQTIHNVQQIIWTSNSQERIHKERAQQSSIWYVF